MLVIQQVEFGLLFFIILAPLNLSCLFVLEPFLWICQETLKSDDTNVSLNERMMYHLYYLPKAMNLSFVVSLHVPLMHNIRI